MSVEEHSGATDDSSPPCAPTEGPSAAPIWFDLDGDTLVFTTGESTVKGRNMRRDARVSLCIDEEEPPFHFVLIEGAADLTAGDPDLLYWATRIGGRYMGTDRADEYGRRNAVEGELLVRIMTTGFGRAAIPRPEFQHFSTPPGSVADDAEPSTPQREHHTR